VSCGNLGARAPAVAAPASVLVVVTRRRGDVLLASPLIRTLKAAWPQAGIDVLVFAGTQGVLEANPDVRNVITIAERPGLFAHLALARRVLRRYDIALSCLAGDRPTAYAVVAGRWRAGMVGSGNGARWKRRMLSRAIAFDDLDTHTAAMNLAFAEILGIARHHEIGIGWNAQDAARVAALLGERALATPYAVLHVHPKFNYKMWHVEGWAGLAHWLRERGFDTILTGGSEPGEKEFVTSAAARMPPGTVNLAGQLTLAQTACVIAGARLFVGPDTVTTHMAGAQGVPTVALYGPSNPVKWGPWPRRFTGAPSPWRRVGTQAMGNVQLVQGSGACVPCMAEGCDRHVASFSDCLQQLQLPAVIAAVERALAAPAA
jgi:heptosyltransferase-3